MLAINEKYSVKNILEEYKDINLTRNDLSKIRRGEMVFSDQEVNKKQINS